MITTTTKKTLTSCPSPGAVRQAIDEAGMSQETVARGMGVSVRTIARWLSGETKPGGLYLDKFIEVVNG